MTTGSGQMGGGDMEHRVGALEQSFTRMEGKLDRLLERQEDTHVRLARIEEKLDHTASSSDLAEAIGRVNAEVNEVKGRVASLPTTIQMITLVFGILGGAFLILKFGLPHGP